jgi:hypothetical protein
MTMPNKKLGYIGLTTGLMVSFSLITVGINPFKESIETKTNGVSLNGTSLNGTSFNGANLNGTSLNGTSFNGANLNGTSLNGTSFNGTNLNGTNLNRERKTLSISEGRVRLEGGQLVIESQP